MPKTVSEAAGVFSSLAQRIEKTWVPHIAKETTFRAGVDWT